MEKTFSADDAADLQIVANTLIAVLCYLAEFPENGPRRHLKERCRFILEVLQREGITPQPDQVDEAYQALVAKCTT